MAEIGPFRGWRYNSKAGTIQDLTSPLYDLTDHIQIEKQYNCPFNIIHLFHPKNHSELNNLINEWKDQQILLQDPIPSIYVYQQEFNDHSNEKKVNKGFICNVKLHDWNDGLILRHEATIPGSVSHRQEILEASEMHICPVHGLYSEKDKILEKYLNQSLLYPIYQFKDQLGVINTFAVIQDLSIIRIFTEVLKDKQIIIADGHHRYEAALKYKKQTALNWKNHVTDYIPFYLTNTESNDLEILPTHRAISGINDFSEDSFFAKLKQFFRVELVEQKAKLEEIIQKKDEKHCFGIVLPNQTYVITLKEGLEKDINWSFPSIIKELDLTILHYFILEKVVGIKGKVQINSKNINFSCKFRNILEGVLNKEFQLGIITKGITQEEVKKVCYSGFTLPQKATYFYPKVLCGLVMSSIRKNEFLIEEKLYTKELNH
jgi:uncharacterized protein (DUF1015 family)